MPFSHLHHLECSRCSKEHDASEPQGTCSCGAPLLARYDLGAIAKSLSPSDIGPRPADLWRYHELLPVCSPRAVVTFGEGMTPMVPLHRAGASMGLPKLVMKDEGVLPTGSFKARGAAAGISRAKELGIDRVAMPTNGNAGAAWAAYAARAGMKATVVMPADAPEINRKESAAAGADLYLVDGLINDAGAIVADAVARFGWFDASTLKEPYRLEGKKTMGLEIVEQLGWRVPDVILYPTGGGVGLIGIHKALRELQEMGWISQRMPRLVAVQASGCAPIVRAFEAGERTSQAWDGASTVAFGITVPKALGDFLVLDAVAETDGCAVAVDDSDILAEQALVATSEGVLLCPEGAATVAAARQLREAGWLKGDEEVLVLNTGTGLKYPQTLEARAPVLAATDRISDRDE